MATYLEHGAAATLAGMPSSEVGTIREEHVVPAIQFVMMKESIYMFPSWRALGQASSYIALNIPTIHIVSFHLKPRTGETILI